MSVDEQPPAGAPFAEARVVLEVSPWSGEPLIDILDVLWID